MSDLPLQEQLDQAIDAQLADTGQADSADPAIARLMDIVGRLRELPDDRFKARLALELRPEPRTERTAETERTAPMPASTNAPAALIHSIMPFISVPEGDKLIDFMKHTFGAEETSRKSHGPDGFVAVLKIGDSDLLVMGGESTRGQERPAALHVYVNDCDAAYQRALEAGAVTIGPPGFGEPADRPYGERSAFVADPSGNYWFIATRLGPDSVGPGLRHVTPGLLPAKAQPLIDFLERAFGAEMGHPHEEGGHLVHAFVRIGKAVVEMAESSEAGLRPFGFYLYTDDVDSVYHRAIAAGAISILPPADQPFGDRLAIVQDPAGNRWFAAKHISHIETEPRP